MPNMAGSYRDTYIPGYIKHSGLQAITKPFKARPLFSLVGRHCNTYKAFSNRDRL